MSKSAHELRCRLYQEHFDITKEEAEDFLNEEVWQKIRKKSRKNTEVYREVFGCYPDDTMRTLKEIEEVEKKARLERYSELKG